MQLKRVPSVQFLMGIALLVLTACTAPAATAPAAAATSTTTESATTVTTDTTSAAAAKTPDSSKPVIKLAENPWSASALNVAVAKILLEEQLGYPVEVTTIGESEQWPAIASGDLDASLEVWPSGHVNDVKEFIEKQKQVENGGPLGPVGKIGWYIPTYMLKDHPELAT